MSMRVHNGTGWEPWAEEAGGGGGPDLTGLVDRSATDLDLSGLGDTGSIHALAFHAWSSLASLTLPAGMTGSIGESAFQGCSSLASLDVPAGITGIGTTASWSLTFHYCTALEYVIFRSTSVVTLGHISSLGGTTCLIYVPADLVDAYKTANNWSTLADRILPIPEELL